MNLPLSRLEGFYWVARTEGYARAARSFPYPITQPGVHQQVKRLEGELGVSLFERVGKDRVVLTPEGRTLYAFVAPFLEQLGSVIAQVQGGEVKGILKVSASGLVLRHLLPSWFRRLHSRRPQLELILSETKTADPNLLRTGEADLVVDHFSEQPDDLMMREVGRAYAFLAVPSSHPAAESGSLSLEALKDEPFVAYNVDRTLRAAQLEVLRQHGITPRRMFSADSAETILGFVAAGLGYSLVPWLASQGPRVAGVVTQRLVRPAASFPIFAAYRKTASANPLIRAALEEAPTVE